MPFRRYLLFVLATALILTRAEAGLAAFGFNDTSWEGTSEFLKLARKELGRDRVEIVATLDYETLSPKDGVLIMHPEVKMHYSEVSAFLRAGGRMAVIDDFGRGDELLKRFQIHRIRAPLTPLRSLRQNPNLALALPVVESVAGQEQGRHPIVRDVQLVATNHPAALSHPDLTPILSIPARDEPDAVCAVTGIIEKRGRLFAMTDPSAFINLMLRYPGNRALAKGLLNYLLQDDSWGERNGKLYLLANHFQQTGQYGGADGVFSQLFGQIRDMSEWLTSEWLRDIRREGLPDLAATLLAAMASILALALMAYLASRPYRRDLPRYARPVPLVTQGGLAGRAAALDAKATSRPLALLELKSALIDGLSERLGLGPNLSAAALLAEIDRQGALSRQSIQDLREIMTYLNSVEDAVAAARPLRISENRVRAIHHRAMRVLDEGKSSQWRAV